MVPVVGCGVGEGAELDDAGVGDQHVEAGVRRHRGLHDASGVGVLGHVADDAGDLGAELAVDLRGHAPQTRGVDVVHDEPRTLGCEPHRRRPADARRGTSDDRHLALQPP